MIFPISKPRIMIVVIIAVLTIAGLFIFVPRVQRSTDDNPPVQTGKNTPDPTNPEKVQSAQTKPTPPTESPTRTCKLFTLQLATQILGDSATLSKPESITTSETADMHVSSCVYTTASRGTVSLTAHLASTPLGQSTNAIEFGSGRPAGVQDVPGQGQAAYWNEGNHTLSVLKNNNRYVLSHSDNSKNSVVTAASIIVPKL